MAIQCRASWASARSRSSPGSRSSTGNHLLPADEPQAWNQSVMSGPERLRGVGLVEQPPLPVAQLRLEVPDLGLQGGEVAYQEVVPGFGIHSVELLAELVARLLVSRDQALVEGDPALGFIRGAAERPGIALVPQPLDLELQSIAPGAKFRGAVSPPGQAPKDQPLALEHQAVARQEVTRHLVMPGRLEYAEAQHGCLPPPMRILDPCFDKIALLAHDITLYSCEVRWGAATCTF